MLARSLRTFWALAAMSALALARPLSAATNLISADEIPPLQPPRGELPPGLWEQYGSWMWLGGAVLAAAAGIVVWRLTRPSPPPVIPPPATEARQALEPLRALPETGAVLSRVSQVLRHYFSLTFGLPPAERTTSEFCRALADLPQVGAELPAKVSDFLRECDLRKFAPAPPQPPLGAVEIATRLIEQAEAGRRNLTQAGSPPLLLRPYDR